MRIVDAEWTEKCNLLTIECECGCSIPHWSDRWKVTCEKCGMEENLGDIRHKVIEEPVLPKKEMIHFKNCNCEFEKGKFDIKNIPLDCKATWSLISAGHTIGVFQLETKLGQDWAKKVRPRNIEELSDLISIMRPGVLDSGQAQEYVDIKFGFKKPAYIHPSLEPILKSTHSVMVYQEALLRIARDLAGFSLQEADTLRKGVTKKSAKLIYKLQSKFMEGCAKNNISNEVAGQIFGWIEKCQKYLFNKSHSICYSDLSYRTAWMKCHFPKEFFVSYLTYSKLKTDPKEEVYKLVQDAKLFNLKILPPNVTKRNIGFEVIDEGILFGLANIKGVGEIAIKSFPELTLDTWGDFLLSVPKLRRNVASALVMSGACDIYGLPRAKMANELEILYGSDETRGLTPRELGYIVNQLKNNSLEQSISNLIKLSQDHIPLSQMKKDQLVEKLLTIDPAFDVSDKKKPDLMSRLKELKYGEDDVIVNKNRIEILTEKVELAKQQSVDTNFAKAMAEKHFLGAAISCSPVDDVDISSASHNCHDFISVQNDANTSICAIIEYVKHTKTKKGKDPGQSMCIMGISDASGSIDGVVVFPGAYEKLHGVCKENMIVLIYGKKQKGSLIVTDIKRLT